MFRHLIPTRAHTKLIKSPFDQVLEIDQVLETVLRETRVNSRIGQTNSA